jgi:hypothetical protein
MPWNGSGTYTRGYPSWTSDAANNLPISATKFDTEDNDFAAGIQNCLTIDNQNKPNASLVWSQSLALSKASDAGVFEVSRTGGTHNPSLTFSVTDSTNAVSAALNTGNNAFVLIPTAYTFGNVVDLPTFAFSGSGITNTTFSAGPNITCNSPANAASFLLFEVNSVIAGYVGCTGSSGTIITGDAPGDICLRTPHNIDFSVNNGVSIQAQINASTNVFSITDNAASPTLYPVGYLALPPNNQSGSYTAVLADQSKQICAQTSSTKTFTIPANASVAYPQGTVLHFVNPPGGGTVTIAITTDTMTFVPAGTTGSRTLTAPGVATAEKIGSTAWIIYGSNLT